MTVLDALRGRARPARELDDSWQNGPRDGWSNGSRTGAKRVVIAMQHTAKGKSKLVKKCTLPLTSTRSGCTELAVVTFPGGRATLLETAPGVAVQEVIANTEAALTVPERVGKWFSEF